MFWILLCIIVFLAIIYEINFRWKFRSLNRFPGPINFPFLGTVLNFIDEKKVMKNLYLAAKTYGSIVKIPLGRQMILQISDPEVIEYFLRSPKFITKAENYMVLEPWLGRGILTADGENWHKTRKLVTPAFHFTILEEHVKMFHNHCDVLLEIFSKDVNTDCPVNIYPKIVHFTLDIIAETAMGIKANVQKTGNNEFLDAMHFMTRLPVERTISLWKKYDFLYRLSTCYQKQKKYVKILEDMAIKVIEERRDLLLKNSAQDCNNGEKKKNIFLDILLSSTMDGKPLSNKKIEIEVNNFIFGGHDTTASAISIMIYKLANNKEVQNKIVEELKEIFGNDEDRSVTMQDLNRMQYMGLVIKEILRYYSIIPFIGRELQEDIDYKGTCIPKGTTLLLFIYGVHNLATNYENPREFCPERFLTQNNKLPFSYIPFSAGPRNCLGQKYAMSEIKVTFAILLRHFEFHSAGPDYKMELQPEMVMKPTNGIYVKISRRKF